MKKWLAARRAQLALKHAFERIDYEEDVVGPEIEAILSGKVKLQIEATSGAAAESIITVTVNDETEKKEEADIEAVASDDLEWGEQD